MYWSNKLQLIYHADLYHNGLNRNIFSIVNPSTYRLFKTIVRTHLHFNWAEFCCVPLFDLPHKFSYKINIIWDDYFRLYQILRGYSKERLFCNTSVVRGSCMCRGYKSKSL